MSYLGMQIYAFFCASYIINVSYFHLKNNINYCHNLQCDYSTQRQRPFDAMPIQFDVASIRCKHIRRNVRSPRRWRNARAGSVRACRAGTDGGRCAGRTQLSTSPLGNVLYILNGTRRAFTKLSILITAF